MKKQSFRMVTVLRNRFLSASVTALLLLVVSNLQAQSIQTDNKAIVKHVGNSADAMYFQILLDNSTGEKIKVSLKDQEGNTVFQEMYTDKKLDKTFSVPRTVDTRMTFHIKSSKSAPVQTFEINSTTKLVEEVIVKRIER